MIMDEKIVKLQELIDQHDNIVFLEEQVYRRRVESRISEAWTDCITNSTITRRRRF